MDINSLERFVSAQSFSYETALTEVKSGYKASHWMWYIFPQLRGLGTSSMAYAYGIDGEAEARAYLEHPLLSARLYEICNVLLGLNKSEPEEIFGYTDALKLRSSMTLFASIAGKNSVFSKVLDKYYDGKTDPLTLRLLGKT